MTEKPRDWDKELADIDRMMSKVPAGSQPAPAPGAPRAALPAATAPAPVAPSGRAATRLLTLLAVVLAAALPLWPYAHSCGIGLFAYLGAVGVLVVAGVAAAAATWTRRLGWAHLLALLATLAGFGYAAAEVLPRIGYAKQAAVWLCR